MQTTGHIDWDTYWLHPRQWRMQKLFRYSNNAQPGTVSSSDGEDDASVRSDHSSVDHQDLVTHEPNETKKDESPADAVSLEKCGVVVQPDVINRRQAQQQAHPGWLRKAVHGAVNRCARDSLWWRDTLPHATTRIKQMIYNKGSNLCPCRCSPHMSVLQHIRRSPTTSAWVTVLVIVSHYNCCHDRLSDPHLVLQHSRPSADIQIKV